MMQYHTKHKHDKHHKIKLMAFMKKRRIQHTTTLTSQAIKNATQNIQQTNAESALTIERINNLESTQNTKQQSQLLSEYNQRK